MQEILGGVVAIIAIAITIGIGTSILGSTGSAFDCKTLDGYTASSTTGHGTAGTETTTSTGGAKQYTIVFSHPATDRGDKPRITMHISNSTGPIDGLEFSVQASTTGNWASGSSGNGNYAVSPTSSGLPAGDVTITVTITGDGSIPIVTTSSYTFTVGNPTDVDASYTGWAKACQDAQRQTTQAWTLIPIILIVIVAAIIITVLRGFYGSTG
ncbi:MAG: hypothetical protein MPK62_00220 [Alphaproteobacteria bacterium]|nr:hypothetical protein [Alphaproteobacteria bacterium]MDA8029562.1 hypothetical protein [Alphaproteobacteria bacterium]